MDGDAVVRFLSLCSGIEAASVAWGPLGWSPVAFSEIEPFPSAVLAHHYPDTPNWGDMTRFKEWPDADVDVLVGGTPCQSFSVAGLRAGLADPRGNLALTYLAIAERYRPEWLVWENVPGVLSSNGGRDFGAFLGGLGKLGYGFAYRVLDAQYFGLAQRRRRVFVVGCLGGWARAAAVLFERESLQGNPPPRREAPERVAPAVTAGAPSSSGYRNDADTAGNLIAFGGNNTAGPIDVATACNAHAGRMDFDSETLVTHALRGEGFDASEDGTGRGTPLVPVAFTQNSRSEVRQIGGDGQVVGALAADAGAQQQNYVAFHNRQDPDVSGDVTHPLGAKDNGLAVLAGEAPCLAVRRLLVEECEALQGFPRGYTLIPYRGKPAADGPRYKAVGNSMAVPVMRWIGERIELVERLAAEEGALDGNELQECAKMLADRHY